MKLAVVGSRDFNDYELLKSRLDIIHKLKIIDLIISGGAIGADSLSEKWAKENRIPSKIFLPDWNTYGKSAGFKRNVEIIYNSDAVIAFWDGLSKGTQHSINLAKEYKKPIAIILFKK
jgi:hypothetical protein